jgi:hypothetical protein
VLGILIIQMVQKLFLRVDLLEWRILANVLTDRPGYRPKILELALNLSQSRQDVILDKLAQDLNLH